MSKAPKKTTEKLKVRKVTVKDLPLRAEKASKVKAGDPLARCVAPSACSCGNTGW